MKNKELKKECRFCKSEINANARICPFCRKKQKREIGLGCCIFLVIIGIFIVLIGLSDPQQPIQVANEPVAEEIVKIDPEELITDYEANEVKGDELYIGKTMELSGKVGSIGKNLLEQVYITFEREEVFAITSVQCFFDDKEEIKKVMDLSKGDKVTVQGKCTGKFGNVTIGECKLK